MRSLYVLWIRLLPVAWLLLVCTSAHARPEVAIVPFDGDRGGRVAAMVAEVARGEAKVTPSSRLKRAMNAADGGELTPAAAKRLRGELDVDVIISGKVTERGKTRRLELTLFGGKRVKLSVSFRSMGDLRDALTDKLGRRIASAGGGGRGDDDDEDVRPFKRADDDRRARDDEAREKKRRDEARAEKKRRDDEARERKRRTDEAREARKRKDSKKRRRGNDDDDDDRRRKKRRIADRDEDEDFDEDELDEDEDEDFDEDDEDGRPRGPARALVQGALWFDAGGAVARRTLTYEAGNAMRPPRVGTAAGSGRFSAEIYPAALAGVRGPAANLGIAGSFDRAFGLGIDVPNTTVTTPIKSGIYAVGARYRFLLGSSVALAVGADYWRRFYMADRSELMDPAQLDMPDVDYTALAPALSARFALTPSLAAFASGEIPLVLSTGPIQDGTSYGTAKIVAFGVRVGVQIGLGSHYAVQIAGEMDQVGHEFAQGMGTMAQLREVRAATDRTMGIAATLGVMY